MGDLRSQIQMARIQDDATLWAQLVTELAEKDAAEALKAMLSGIMRAAPGGTIKDKAVEMIVASLEEIRLRDLKTAMDAAVTGAIYSKPDSDTRHKATAFIVAHVEDLATIDTNLAKNNSEFALRWAKPGSEIEREAAHVWERLASEPLVAEPSAATS